MDGWFFKTGNDTVWKENDINLEGWKKLRPDQLSSKYVDKDGRLEGWFRIKLRLDSSFNSHLVGFRIVSWAASDVYINGNHIASFGNTGSNGEPFEEFRAQKCIFPQQSI